MIYPAKKANNAVEYVLLFVMVGLIFGTALYMIKPDAFKSAFKYVFGNSTNSTQENSDSSITISPMSE